MCRVFPELKVTLCILLLVNKTLKWKTLRVLLLFILVESNYPTSVLIPLATCSFAKWGWLHIVFSIFADINQLFYFTNWFFFLSNNDEFGEAVRIDIWYNIIWISCSIWWYAVRYQYSKLRKKITAFGDILIVSGHQLLWSCTYQVLYAEMCIRCTKMLLIPLMFINNY